MLSLPRTSLLCLGRHIKAHQSQFSFIRRNTAAIATHSHCVCLSDCEVASKARFYMFVLAELLFMRHHRFYFFFFFLKPPSLHLNFFFFFLKMNHLLMYTHCGSLSSLLKTTQSVCRNWVVSGLLVHIKSCEFFRGRWSADLLQLILLHTSVSAVE